jgi:hypothetical protein
VWDEAERSIYNRRLPGGEFAAVSQFGALRYADVPFASAFGGLGHVGGRRLLPFGRGVSAGTVGFRGCIMGSTRNIVVVIAVVLSACAAEHRESLTPRAPTLEEQSPLLKIGMSEQEVTKLLGLPSKAEAGQCGENTPRPWTCKTWTYSSTPFYGLQAFFRENAGEWRLASWNVGL